MKNVKCSNTAKVDLRDWCLLWGCPGIAILIISLLISLKVGDDFGQDNYVRLATFLIATALQGMVYYLFMSVLADVPLKWRNRQQDEVLFLGLLVKMGGEIFVKAYIYLPLHHLLLI